MYDLGRLSGVFVPVGSKLGQRGMLQLAVGIHARGHFAALQAALPVVVIVFGAVSIGIEGDAIAVGGGGADAFATVCGWGERALLVGRGEGALAGSRMTVGKLLCALCDYCRCRRAG